MVSNFYLNIYYQFYLFINVLSFRKKEMEPNREDSLKTSLLRHSESTTGNSLQSSTTDHKDSRTVMFKIGGIKCASCAVSIESIVRKMKGIQNITVSPLQGQAAITYLPEVITVSVLKLSACH